MTDQKEPTICVKLCTKCGVVKTRTEGFYKSGNSWQKYCKPCHNKLRKGFKNSNKPYIFKKKGFAKLPTELQEKIKYDIHTKVSYKDISRKYEEINYLTLLSWKKKGIPVYVSK